jgi:hypothetical protein
MSALLTETFLLAADLLRAAVEKGPEPEDVKAGWAAFGIFLALGLAVVFLGFSLVKQLRKAQANKDAGAFGDEPVAPTTERDDD